MGWWLDCREVGCVREMCACLPHCTTKSACNLTCTPKNKGLFPKNNGRFSGNNGHFSGNKGLFRGDVAFSCFAFSITSKKVPTRKWKMAESYLLHKNLHYNGLMSGLGLTPHAFARVRVCTRVLHFFAVTSVTDWYKSLKFSFVSFVFDLFWRPDAVTALVLLLVSSELVYFL